jgi:hypothetical protein
MQIHHPNNVMVNNHAHDLYPTTLRPSSIPLEDAQAISVSTHYDEPVAARQSSELYDHGDIIPANMKECGTNH